MLQAGRAKVVPHKRVDGAQTEREFARQRSFGKEKVQSLGGKCVEEQSKEKTRGELIRRPKEVVGVWDAVI